MGEVDQTGTRGEREKKTMDLPKKRIYVLMMSVFSSKLTVYSQENFSGESRIFTDTDGNVPKTLKATVSVVSLVNKFFIVKLIAFHENGPFPPASDREWQSLAHLSRARLQGECVN